MKNARQRRKHNAKKKGDFNRMQDHPPCACGGRTPLLLHKHALRRGAETCEWGGGYGQFENSEGGTLTVTARVSSGSPRHAMPSMGFVDFDYAALLYKDDEIPANPEAKDFVQGTATEDGKLIFSFQRPDDTDGAFTLELFAFAKTEGGADEDAMQFSRETALLSGKKAGLEIVGDKIVIEKAIPLSSDKPGTVSLKIKVPDECSLEIDDTANFNCKKDDSASDAYMIVEKNGASGIATGAYQVTFTVKKDEEIIYIFSEYINVINGLCTDKWWNGDVSSEVKDVSQSMSKTVYVRGTGGWYDVSDYKNTATASDENSGSFLSPLASIQKAIDKIIAINDGSSAYTIYVDGKLDGTAAAKLGDNGMADFINLNKNLNLTIKALSNEATLDAGARIGSDDTATVEGIGKHVIYAKPASGTLNLTLENLTITGGNSSEEGGGGIYVSGSTLNMKNCKVEGNITTSYRGGGIFAFGSGTVIMDGGTISRNEVRGTTSFNQNYGGGVYVSSGRFTMKGDAIISENIFANATSRYGGNVYVGSGTFEMEGGTISGGNGTYGGGVFVCNNSTFTMKGGEISGGNAEYGGGVYVTGSESTFTMKGGTIGGNVGGENTANTESKGGGVYVYSGEFTMNGGTISGNKTTYGGGVYVYSGEFTMNGGTISGNKTTYGGGVYVYNKATNATLTMNDGTISKNTAQYGGGVYVYGTSTSGNTFTMSGGTISSNNASGDGGGVAVNGGTFTMNDGTVSNNTAVYGAGIHVNGGGKVTMSGGSISGNTATGTAEDAGGGGVYAYNGSTFTMEGGTVSGNTAQNTQGNGAFVCPDCALNMSGKAQFAKDDDVYLYAYDNSTIPKITVAGSLTAASPVATITPSDYTAGRQVLSADGVMLYNYDCKKFAVTPDSDGADWSIAPDASYKAGMLIRPSFYVRGSGAGWYAENPAFTASAGSDTTGKGSKTKPFATIQKAIDEVTAQSEVIAQKDGSSGEYTIYVDGTLTLNDTPTNGMADFYAFNQRITLTITALSETTKATLDANQKSRVIYAKPKGGSLILTMKNLVITKGRIYTPSSEARGGGIYWDGSQLTIDGCIISENSAARSYSYKSAGGGIYSDGRLIMDDCIISKNTAANGGGIYNFSQFIMHSGSISGNEATDGDGGGFYNDGSGANYFVMDAGTISGNTASGNGGGVYDQRGKFTQNGGTVNGNTPNDVYDQP